MADPRANRPPLVLIGMGGLGDNVYSRPVLRAAVAQYPTVYYQTPWPELFTDLDVRCLPHPNRNLRTQRKNMDRTTLYGHEKPARARERLLGYPIRGRVSITQGLEDRFPLRGTPFVFDLPDTGPSPVRSRRPVAVVRPVTVRLEWPNPARNPRHQYVTHAAEILKDRGFYVVSVADIDPPHEVLVGDPPPADRVFHKGELDTNQLVALIRHARVAVGGFGFVLPVSIATRTPVVVIGGGHGRYNNPRMTTDPRMDLSAVRFLMPEPFCGCKDMRHDCPKRIPAFADRFRGCLDEITTVREAA